MMRPEIVIFLILSFSPLLSRAASDDNKTEDQIDLNCFSCRGNRHPFIAPQDSPDGIVPVRVKDQENGSDPDTGLGAVFQEYSIGQTEVTARQYCNYLNAVATGENYQRFYNEKMGTDPNVASIKRDVIDGKNVYTVIVDQQGDRGDFPIVYVSLYQAARFCNWLQNQNTPGLTGDELTERGAYTLDGKNSGRIARNSGAVWFIPTEDEWYKPAYYKGGEEQTGYWHFANRSDWAPTNGFEATRNAANYCGSTYTKGKPPYLTDVYHFKKSVGTYNTYDMSGNVAEWVATEEDQGATPLKYVARGGSWKSLYYGTGVESKCDIGDWGFELSKWSRPAYDPAQGYDNIGFRVATWLLVDSAPPAKPAPGESELSPTEMIELPLTIIAGAAVLVSGKKIMEHEQSAENKKSEEALAENSQRRRSLNAGEGSSPTSSPRSEGGAVEEKITLESEQQCFSGQKDQSSSLHDPLREEKSALRKKAAQINEFFNEAHDQYLKGKVIVTGKGTIDEAGRTTLTQMWEAYDRYAETVDEMAHELQKTFPQEIKALTDWHQAAVAVLIEAMTLRHSAIREYCSHKEIAMLGSKPHDEETEMKKRCNEKIALSLEQIKGHHEALQSLVQSEETSPEKEASFLGKAIRKIEAEISDLQTITEANQQHQVSSATTAAAMEAALLAGDYSRYASEKTKITSIDGTNMHALFSLRDTRIDIKPVNLVSALGLQDRLQVLLKENVTSRRSSPNVTVVMTEIYTAALTSDMAGGNPARRNLSSQMDAAASSQGSKKAEATARK